VASQRDFRLALALVFVPFPDTFLLDPCLNLGPIAIAITNASGADVACLGGG
jgi:hypothetical protein